MKGGGYNYGLSFWNGRRCRQLEEGCTSSTEGIWEKKKSKFGPGSQALGIKNSQRAKAKFTLAVTDRFHKKKKICED